MKLKDFVRENQDILIAPLTMEELNTLSDGMVVFVITCFKGSSPLAERTVRSAGYQMVAATNRTNGKLTAANTLALTSNGYAKIDYILPQDIARGNKVLYRCKPLPLNDLRRNHHWRIS